ncbi:MAG: protein kinase [Kiritimatiellae bacterium]|nr:protein kinase [Kiritimatiellia bacterium]
MNDKSINDDVTMPGGEKPLLAGRYRVVKQLGQGGMGSVWLAEDTKLDNKRFAVKMLPSILVSDRRSYERLKHEALVAMKLTHPNIVALRAFEDNGGNPFLVMDYIDGWTLDDFLAQNGKFPEEDAVALLKPVASALDYAHSIGVVHRDIKPANIMIDNEWRSYILDFGIAREMQETMTRVTGMLSSGTLQYMSPEQLHGADPSPAQDVYSFAAMAYECLSGKPPFSRGRIEIQIDNDIPAKLDPHLAIGGSVMAGLAKDPQKRPASCMSLLVPERRRSIRTGPRDRRSAKSCIQTWTVALAVISLAIATACVVYAANAKNGQRRMASAYATAKAENEEYGKRLESRQRESKAAEDRLNIAVEDLRATREDLQTARKQLQNVEKEKKEKDDSEKTLMDRIDVLVADKSVLLEKQAECENLIAKMTRKIEGLNHDVEAAVQETAVAKEELEKSTETVEMLKKQIQDLLQ